MTGRRPGESGTREAILAAAKEAFGTRGYDATSLRGIARAAGVAPPSPTRTRPRCCASC